MSSATYSMTSSFICVLSNASLKMLSDASQLGKHCSALLRLLSFANAALRNYMKNQRLLSFTKAWKT